MQIFLSSTMHEFFGMADHEKCAISSILMFSISFFNKAMLCCRLLITTAEDPTYGANFSTYVKSFFSNAVNVKTIFFN